MVKAWKAVLLLAVAILALLFWKCQSDASIAEARGVDKELLRVKDSTIKALHKDLATTVARVVRLRGDSAALAVQSVALRATFERDLARWRAMATAVRRDTVRLTMPAESLPSLDAVLAQADATIASCRAGTANCEQRAANAESRAVASDSLWRNAERRVGQVQHEADIFRRQAHPSVWEQLKRVPRQVVPTATLIGVTWAVCKAGGG